MRTPISALYRAWLRGWNYSTYIANVIAPHDIEMFNHMYQQFDADRVKHFLLNK